jgi:ribosomal protein S18 acetylase RimI-like enzyme
MLDVKELSENDIPQVLLLSQQIFNPPEAESDYHHLLSVWQEHYKNDGLILGAYLNEELSGFVCFYEKENGSGSYHCWMAGVAETARGRGILKSLITRAEEIAREKGYTHISINTYPEKYPAMFHYLQKYNYLQYKVEDREWQGKMTKKAFFRKLLLSTKKPLR